MKKTNYLLLVLTLILISCGKKSEDGVEKKDNEDSTEYCLISDLNGIYYDVTKKGSDELYTGIAVEKDQSDSIIRKIEIKKGWLVREVNREKINDKYITQSDYNYENSQQTDGYELKFENYQGYNYVTQYSEYKNGKLFNEWECSISPLINYVSFKWVVKNFEFISYDSMPELDCMEGYYSSNHYLFKDEENPEEYNRILECLKKELSYFNYWKEN